MGVVHYDKGTEILGKFAKFRELRNVPFHRVDPFQNENLFHWIVLALQNFAKMVRVVMGKALATGTAQLDPAPERRMEILVGEEQVLAICEPGHCGGAC
jgi:hypothetical protein